MLRINAVVSRNRSTPSVCKTEVIAGFAGVSRRSELPECDNRNTNKEE